MLAQKKPGPCPLVCSELLELIFSNLKIEDILYSCLTVNHQWNSEAFRVILKLKEREFREDLDFIKYRLDCSEQEITVFIQFSILRVMIGLLQEKKLQTFMQ